MTTNGESEQGRGLPVGWGWRDIDGPKGPGVESLYLYGPGVVEAQNFNGAAYNDGSWDAYTGPRRTADVDGKMMPPGSPRSPALLAAAQRAAEAALWARDGFGVGEVRGLVLGDEWAMPVGFALDTTKPSPMALPGLPGLWTLTRVSSARPITVDAARAPVAEPAPRFDDMKPREPGCLCHQEEGDSPCPVHPSEDEDPGAVVIPLWLARLTTEQIKRINAIPATGPAPWDIADGALAEAIAGPTAEPAPRPTCPGGAEAHNRALLAGHRCTACGVARQDAEDAAPWRWVPTIHRLPSGTETVMLGSPDRAEPALREPSASLFSLGLLGDAGAAILRAADGAEPPAPTGDPGDELARLLGALGWDEPTLYARAEVDPVGTLRLALDRLGLRDRNTDSPSVVLAVGALATVATLRARVDELEAAVRQVEQERSCDLAVLDATAANLHSAERRLATLGAPSPLDLAVAEVCALLPREYKSTSPVLLGFLEQAAGKIAVAKQNLYDDDRSGARVSVVDAAADLLAGMLACAPADGGKEPGQ